jgi:hypothetical protein
MDDGDQRCGREPRIGEWRELGMVVQDIERASRSVLERVRDMQTFVHLGIQQWILCVSVWSDRAEARASDRISRRGQRDVHAASHRTFGQHRYHAFPRPVCSGGTRQAIGASMPTRRRSAMLLEVAHASGMQTREYSLATQGPC